ncbi:hypothetical protein O9G_003167 [Rozella allomycis CSF55]|uniref:Uncharacterized protein n=1 Tax=Rozella allomycis (strain CSF55) TaxID=988480 RepID=A0A075AZK0_ROZAC|nr:hypothetical protein O9G_003167 [Rozella allomycis CSF55]|eukprot:EPZ34087.1 hypothetical protein O9G_003167 [Rozella allomycis CSF55]
MGSTLDYEKIESSKLAQNDLQLSIFQYKNARIEYLTSLKPNYTTLHYFLSQCKLYISYQECFNEIFEHTNFLKQFNEKHIVKVHSGNSVESEFKILLNMAKSFVNIDHVPFIIKNDLGMIFSLVVEKNRWPLAVLGEIIKHDSVKVYIKYRELYIHDSSFYLEVITLVLRLTSDPEESKKILAFVRNNPYLNQNYTVETLLTKILTAIEEDWAALSEEAPMKQFVVRKLIPIVAFFNDSPKVYCQSLFWTERLFDLEYDSLKLAVYFERPKIVDHFLSRKDPFSNSSLSTYLKFLRESVKIVSMQDNEKIFEILMKYSLDKISLKNIVAIVKIIPNNKKYKYWQVIVGLPGFLKVVQASSDYFAVDYTAKILKKLQEEEPCNKIEKIVQDIQNVRASMTLPRALKSSFNNLFNSA